MCNHALAGHHIESRGRGSGRGQFWPVVTLSVGGGQRCRQQCRLLLPVKGTVSKSRNQELENSVDLCNEIGHSIYIYIFVISNHINQYLYILYVYIDVYKGRRHDCSVPVHRQPCGACIDTAGKSVPTRGRSESCPFSLVKAVTGLVPNLLINTR